MKMDIGWQIGRGKEGIGNIMRYDSFWIVIALFWQVKMGRDFVQFGFYVFWS